MYKKKYSVNSYEANNKLQLKLNCIFQWFSEIAWEHAKILDVGFEDMKGIDAFWVLIGIKLKINELPKWQDRTTLYTEPTGIEGLYFSREFTLKDDNNKVLLEADSKWLIIDKNTGKPIKSVATTYQHLKDKKTKLDFEFERLREKRNSNNIYKASAEYTDIDLHQHVNNAVYVRWIENILWNIGRISTNDISIFNIQFLKEMRQGDNVIINFSDTINNKIFCEAIIENTNIHCFRAEIELI
jgi:acyl-ACP thioesterase